MLDNKFFFTLVGLIVAVFAMCNMNFGPKSTENYWGNGARTVKVMREVRTPTGTYALQNNYQGMLGNSKFVQTPSFQSVLSPRFTNVDLGANIRTNMPDYKNMASPCSPLTYSQMVQENYDENMPIGGYDDEGNGVSEGYCGQCSQKNGCAPSCKRGGLPLSNNVGNVPVPPNYSAGNYQQEMEKVWSSGNETLDSLPVGNMTTVNAAGEVVQPVVYDRYMYAVDCDHKVIKLEVTSLSFLVTMVGSTPLLILILTWNPVL
jgi:hypothetical protein